MPAHIESNEQQIKKHIIEIMTLVKKRLHIHGIKIGTGKEELPIEFASVKSLTLVERIQKRGCAVSSNRFADIFTSRPNRMVATTIEELVFTYETILELDLQILSANELLELCHLTRLPIAHISRFAKYFADDEWRTALQFYQLIPMHTQADNVCIGRDELLHEVTECLFAERRKGNAWRHHVLLSGPSGIGKSTLALAVIRLIMPAYGRRIPVVAIGTGFTAMEQVYQAVGLTMRMRLRADEPWYTRLKDADEFRNTIICLDNVLGNDALPAEAIVRHMLHTFPTTQFLITSQIAGLGRHMPAIREFALTGLNEESIRALYWQIYNQTHLRHHDGVLPADIVTQTHGYPMHIIALANSGGSQAIALEVIYQRVMSGLGEIPELLLQIMALVQQPLGNQFWGLIDAIILPDKQQPLMGYLHLLERRQLISYRNGDGFVIHDAMRTAVYSMCNTDQIDALICRIAHQLTQSPQQMVLFDEERYALQLQIHDVLAIYDILVLVHQRGMDELAARMIVRWRTSWIRFGLCAQLCVISEATVYRIGPNHPQTSELLHAIGSFYGHRGIVESTMRFLQQAMHHADLGLQRVIWAQSALECALHALQLIGWQESERLLQRAMAVMNSLHYEYWVARCHDTLSYVYMTTGKIRESLAQSDAALLHYEAQAQAQSLWLADAYSNRGLIFMALGDYVLARQSLSKAEWLFQQYNAPNNIAAVHLRIAAVAALENRAGDARFYLTQAFRQIERVGGFNDLLYVIDIGAGVALTDGDGATALQLSNACSAVRAQMGLSRGAVFDDIVQRQLVHAHARQLDATQPPLASNINELLAVVRQILQVNY